MFNLHKSTPYAWNENLELEIKTLCPRIKKPWATSPSIPTTQLEVMSLLFSSLW
jgi:hypothetical protein